MAQRIVGIDLSARAARIVVLATTLRKTELEKAVSVPVSKDLPRKDVLAAVHAAIGGQADSLILTADPRLCSTRLLHFPFGDARKVESAVLFELENQVPYDMAATALTWQVVSRTANSSDVLAAIMPKGPLVELIADAESAGLEPRAVVLAEVGLLELVAHHGPEPVAIASLGEGITHVAIARNGTRYVRTLRSGGQDVDRSLARAFGVDAAAAKAAKEGDLTLLGAVAEDHERVQQGVAAGLSPLVTGLSTTFKSLAAEDAPARLYLTGGLSRLAGLCEYLSQKLGIPVELIDLPAVLASAGAPYAKRATEQDAASARAPELSTPIGPEYAVALGLALAKMRYGRGTPLNFRRGELAYQGDIQLYRGHAMRIAMGLAAVFLLAIAGSIVRYSMTTAEEKRINAAFCTATKKIIGHEICDPTAALATMRQAPGASEGVVIPTYSAGTLLEMMSKTVSKDIDVTFDELELHVDGRAGEPDRVTGKGEVASFEATEQVAASLKRDACVQEVDVTKQRKVRDGGRVEFNLSVKVSCPSGAVPGQSIAAKSSAPAGADAPSDAGAGVAPGAGGAP